eukprot:Nitzschia sp. Nitz4//scaffold35_size145790//119635//120438//NITZ4_003052-RA/size145790-processed-gene-0.247-mRNA-1//-1//CDS//3329549190//5404//frame0
MVEEPEVEGVLQHVDVVYCGQCGMPPEYCEYGPDFESHCNPWLKTNHPELHQQLKATRTTVTTATQGDSHEAEDKPARPSAPWTTEERLTAFYEKYQPDKVSDVPSLIEKYAGKEDKLFLALVKKYGPEPDDPFYAEDEEEDEGEDDEDLEGVGGKRRGAKAKKAKAVETRVIIQKEQRNKRKATTVVVGLETVPGIKLKDAAKAFSKRFAGSSSVKEVKSKQNKVSQHIILQGDHVDDVAVMLVEKFQVAPSSIFLEMGNELVPYE